jgi:hypothetical protein
MPYFSFINGGKVDMDTLNHQHSDNSGSYSGYRLI